VVKRTIAALLIDEDYARYIRENARACSLTWDKIAGDWVRHWDEALKKEKRSRIVISGYYGFKNLGDEAILSCMVKEIKAARPETEITVISNDPFETEKMHQVKAIPENDFRMQAREVEKADLIVLGGGGLFQDHYPIRIFQFFESHRQGMSRYGNLPLMAKIYKKPLLYYAHGIGPLFSKESFLFTEWACGLADHITVRDNYSYNLLTELLNIDKSKIALGYDPVLRAPVPSKARSKCLSLSHDLPEEGRFIIVTPRFWIDKYLEDKVVRIITESLNSFLGGSSEYYVLLVPFHRDKGNNSDIPICEKIGKGLKLPFAIIRQYSRYEEILSLYCSAEFALCMRYHSLLFSAITGTPMVAISYDKKDDQFMNEIQLPDLLIPMKDIETRKMEKCFQFMIDHRQHIRTHLSSIIQEILSQRAESSFFLKKAGKANS
jgi:polysaccharide pyruvyl transferase CsaB